MRRSRPTRTRGSQQGGGVSLFPFLAVLICTMGSLIVLLVVLARQARLQAAESASAAAAQAAVGLDEIKAQRELAQWQAEQLRQSRTKTEADLAEARLKLGGIEDHIRALRDEIDKLQAAWGELDRAAAGTVEEHRRREAELAKVKAQIAEAGRRLADELKALRQRRECYAVIPYEGANKTQRRPVYIECRADAVIVQPEGIVLTEADFDGPMGPGNPLAAALRASREYLAAHGAPGPDGPPEPYPLLLVRPDGIVAYYAARAAMESWGSEFGYELIGQDWKLTFPAADAELARVVSQAVQTARQRQVLLARIAPRQAGSQGRPVYRAGSRGIVREDAPENEDDMPLPARSTRPGFGHNGLSGPGGTGVGEGSGLAGRPGFARPGAGTGGAMGGSGLAGQRPGDGLGSGTGGSDTLGSGTGGSDTRGSGTRGSGTGGPGDVGSPGDYTPGQHSHVFGGQFGTGGGRDAGVGSAGSGAESGAGSSLAGGGSGGACPEGGTSPGGADQGGQTVAVQRPEDYVAGRPTEGQAASGANALPLRPGEWEPTPPPSRKKPPLELKASARQQPGARAGSSLANMRGRNWGLPDNSPGAIPITRPIRVDCYPDRLVIAADDAKGARVIRLGPRTQTSVDELVSAVWDHMDAWGIAGRGMYWRPVLSLHVTPGAETRYEDLNTLLQESGLRMEKK